MFILFICLWFTSVRASLPLSGKLIVIDPGHGGKDPGTIYGAILEKNINLEISMALEKELIKNGASVVLTRDGDYDLAAPDVDRRKKSDFDNRIRLINNSGADLYLSIHINHLPDQSYSGGQIFYYSETNKKLAQILQDKFNEISHKREIKIMPDIYMYRRLKLPGVLVECGFLSNSKERILLQQSDYQIQMAKQITNGLIEYFN